MVRYYRTAGIYDKADLLRLEVKYIKGKGYVVEVNPTFKTEYSWGIIYNKEYYQYYNTLSCMLIPCSRRSDKREKEAYEIAEKKIDWLLEQYVTMVDNKGGRHIEIIGEVKEWRQDV
jgi:hypothetical protein